jgi:glycosidase
MKKIILSICIMVFFDSIKLNAQAPSHVKHPAWAASANMYEVNLRQFTPEGNIKAFMPHLKRLKDLGIDILWFMPVTPIGVENRKGGLGSYYSVKDYTQVNPEFGTMDEFKELVKQAHSLDMKVIVDWVGNHSAWDNPWAASHPDYYKKDSLGKFVSPWDWTDVIALNYENKKLRKAMIEAMKFWVKETDIDGFRCDVAFLVPTDFWNEARKALDKVKPVYMLAEAETPDLHEKAFDANYAWEIMHLLNKVAKNEEDIKKVKDYKLRNDSIFHPNVYRLSFVTNHDENSWNGTEFERFGEQVQNFTTLLYTLHGQPLVYTGQEAGLNRRLSFFEKDSVVWDYLPYNNLIRRLLHLRHQEKALWSGYEANQPKFYDNMPKGVLAFERNMADSKVIVAINTGNTDISFTLPETGFYQNVLDEGTVNLDPKHVIHLKPYQPIVLRLLQ